MSNKEKFFNGKIINKREIIDNKDTSKILKLRKFVQDFEGKHNPKNIEELFSKSTKNLNYKKS